MIRNQLRAVLSASLKHLPGGLKLSELMTSYRLRRGVGVGGRKEPKDIFTYIYEQKHWGRRESISGPGSTIEYTENIRREIPKLILELNVRRFLDAPCGDYNWFRFVPRVNGFEYIGGDIVSELVRQNQTAFGGPATQFVELDIINQPIPSGDMWLCRDVLFHFSNHQVFRTLANLLRSEVRYFLTSSHTEAESNSDIPTGYFRYLNLELPPFNLGKPIVYIDDWIQGHAVRKLGLWERTTLVGRLNENPAFLKSLETDVSPTTLRAGD